MYQQLIDLGQTLPAPTADLHRDEHLIRGCQSRVWIRWFVPFQAYNGEQALELLKKENPDLILLDVMLPDIDGTALCLQMRKSSNI